MRVLIFDSDDYYRQFLCERLESVADEIIAEPSGQSVLEKIQQSKPNVIITELIFSEPPSGYEVIRKIKNHAQYKQLPVVIFSRVNNLEDVGQAMGLGAASYLIKGYHSVSELIDLIKRINK